MIDGKIGLRRELSRYASVSPQAIAEGSAAQVAFFVEDAKHDIAVLAGRVSELETEIQRLRQAAPVLDHETIARIIDPAAFVHGPHYSVESWIFRRQDARRKANAIITAIKGGV